MNEPTAISPFQILDWRILSFNCTNSIISVPEDVAHHWTLKAHIDYLEPSDDQLNAILYIEFHFSMEHRGSANTMEGQCVTPCVMKTDSISNAEELFNKFLSRTAMTNSLANLRVFLLQAGTLHQMGPKRVMLPFINLNNFTFDEEMKFTV